MKVNCLLPVFFLASLLSAPAAFCAAPAKAVTNVTSERMLYDSAGKKVTFFDKVKVTHPDFTLNSDRMDVFLSQSSGSPRQVVGESLNPGAIRVVVAESKVSMTLPDGRTATCAKATYSVADETMTMEGNPVLREGLNQVRGDKMIFYLRENRNEVQGRVAVDFISGGEAGSRPTGLAGGG